jgi:protein tyrosine phosphatase
MSCYEDIPSGSHTKNRYKHVLPTPQTRVPLFLHFDEPTSDYINANFIRGYNDTPKAYIATQSPIESTVNDFWRMVWEHHVTVILMATHLIEGDVPRCTQYWPDNDSATLQCDNLEVKLLNQERNDFSIVSRFHLKQNVGKHSLHSPIITETICHLQYTRRICVRFYTTGLQHGQLVLYLMTPQILLPT